MIRATVLTFSTLALSFVIGPAHAQSAENCAVHLSPCHVDTRLRMAGIKDSQDARDFLARLKSAAQAGDHHSLASMIRYPLTIYVDGKVAAIYQDPGKLLEEFTAVFTPSVISAIKGAEYRELFVNDQGAMIGNGEIWFSGSDGVILIKAVNP